MIYLTRFCIGRIHQIMRYEVIKCLKQYVQFAMTRILHLSSQEAYFQKRHVHDVPVMVPVCLPVFVKDSFKKSSITT